MRTLSAFGVGRLMATVMVAISFAVIPAGLKEAKANSKYAGIVVDAKTGKTLYSYKADSTRYPASLTKMMTMYMMFEALDSGKMTKKTRIRMSKYAASKPPSKLGIKPGRSIAAEHAILALATKSANDVAAAVAEHLGGSESNFGKMMTRKARQLGMKRTTFKNASGLTAKGQVTTARDMARLGIALREHFPQYYRYFSTRTFKYGKAKYGNHNRLLGRVKGVDGIKTGYTRASGFNLVSSVQANRRSIVAVVLGGRSGKSRNAQMQKLISQYLRKASRGSKKQLIASRKSTSFAIATADIRLPKRGPMPTFRQTVVAKKTIQTANPVTVASATTTPSINQRMAQAPVPELRPAEPLAYVDPVTTGTNQQLQVPTGGWVIQIGATDSKQRALGLLESAKSKVPGVLNGKSVYTEKVEKGSTILHRARFAGFAGKSDARNACKALKRKKIACLALNT
ncbi:MAG: D-alanyl-D-alanine carboxypeptidase [Pseudomonadota bacterium]